MKTIKQYLLPIVLWSAVIALAIYIAALFFASSDYLEVAFIDVGQGDAAFILPPSGTTVLVDAGGNRRGTTNVGRDIIGSYLISRGVRSIDKAIVSHYHEDHALGFIELADLMKINAFFMPDSERRPQLHNDLVAVAESANADIYYLSRGHIINVDSETVFEVLFPLAAEETYHSGITFFRGGTPEPNNDSLVMRLQFGNASFLFTGDLERRGELALLRDPRLNADVLKVAHHGSQTSTSPEFLDVVSPRYAVISAGLNNQFGHPHNDVLARLMGGGTTIYRTDLQGTITFLVDKSGVFTIRTAR
jgi:competence protein ComEC